MNNKKVALIIVVIILVTISLCCFITSLSAYFFTRDVSMRMVSNFEECLFMDYAISETSPRQCTTPDGRTFVEELNYPDYPDATSTPIPNKVVINFPNKQSQLNSPQYIEGEAVGNWFWEGAFTIELRSDNGDVIGSTVATTTGYWMQEGYVKFTATLIYETTEKSGNLVFIKANPSGMPENAEEYSIPVRISVSRGTDGCVVTGCSSQLCANDHVVTTCEFLMHYGCYTNATCEKQSNGECGWTESPELLECLKESL
jgi:hypothetical protein